MSSRDYMAALEEEDPREDESLGEPEEEPAARAGITLDPVEFRVSRREVASRTGDDALDVAESEARKGPSGVTRSPRTRTASEYSDRSAWATDLDAGTSAADELAAGRSRASALDSMRGDVSRRLREFSNAPPSMDDGEEDWYDMPLGLAEGAVRGMAGGAADLLDSGAAIPAGVVQGATMNLGDDIYGAMEALEGNAGFEEARGEARRNLREARAGSPGLYDLGHAAGATGTALAIPAVGAESVMGRVMGEGAVNAGLGFIEGAGGYEGDDLEAGLDEAMANAVRSGGYGMAGRALLGEALPAGMSALGRFADQADRLRLGSVMGGRGANPLSTAAERAIEDLPGGLPAAAERVRRLGIGSTFGTAADAAARSDAAIDATDEALARYYRALEEANPEGVPVADLVAALEEPAEFAATHAAGVPHVGRVADVANNFETAAANRGSSMYPIREPPAPGRPLGGLLGDFRMMREGLRYGTPSPAPAIDRMVYNSLRNALDDIAERTVGNSDEFRRLRGDRVLAGLVNEAASDAARRGARGIGPLGRMVREGTRFGSLAGLRELATDSMPSMRATAAETVRALLSRSPESLGEYAPIFARALTRGGPDLLEAIVGRAVESDPALGERLTTEGAEPTADDLFREYGVEAEPAADELTADDLFNEYGVN